MADPLSITVAALSIIKATTSTIKVVRATSHAAEEIDPLAAELEALVSAISGVDVLLGGGQCLQDLPLPYELDGLRGVIEVVLGMRQHVEIGNLDLTLDWGRAKDGVQGMWLALQHAEASLSFSVERGASPLRFVVEEDRRDRKYVIGSTIVPEYVQPCRFRCCIGCSRCDWSVFVDGKYLCLAEDFGRSSM